MFSLTLEKNYIYTISHCQRITFTLSHCQRIALTVLHCQERYPTDCGKVSFSQPWADYKAGFGDLADFQCDFWLGLEKIHRLTSNPDRVYKLDTTLAFQDPRLEDYYQTYLEGFYVEDEANGYRLHSTGWHDGEFLGLNLGVARSLVSRLLVSSSFFMSRFI